MTFEVSFDKLTRPVTFTVSSCAISISPVQPMTAPVRISIDVPENTTGADKEE